MKKEKYSCLYPAGLHLEKTIKRIPPDFKYNLDYFYFLINEISIKSTYIMEENDWESWVGMCSSIMKKHPYKYNEHFKYLISEKTDGGILWGKKYSTGKCFSYRLATKYFMQTFKTYEITDYKLIKYINKSQNEKIISNNKFKKKYNFLAKYFESGLLKIDLKGAMDENYEIFKSGNCLPYEALLKQRLIAIQITRISNENYSLSYSYKTDGRIHSQITNLNKNLRKYMTYNGKRLTEVDIKSSVPTFFIYILKEILKEEKSDNLIKVINNISDYHHMCRKSLKSVDISEVESFGNHISNGTFYESFYGDYEKGIDKAQLRKKIKNNILSMMFADKNGYKKTQKIFGKHYPNLLSWIIQFKEENHKLFSYLTMQIEAHFMLNTVARIINKKHNGKIIMFSLHDCLITTENDLEIVYNMIDDILTKEMGFSPILTKDVWK